MDFGRVTITDAAGHERSAPLNRATVRIGSAPTNDIVLDDPLAAPQHAEILCDPTGCMVLDLSGGATLLDGAPLAQNPQSLATGNVLSIGVTRIAVRIGAQPASDPLLESLLGMPPAGDGDLLQQLLGTTPPLPARRAQSPRATRPLRPTTPATPSLQPGAPTSPPAQAPVAPLPPAPEAPAPTPETPSLISLRLLSPAEIAIEASASATVKLRIANDSELVTRVDLSTDGIPQTWVDLPAEIPALFPGERREVEFTINPSRPPLGLAKTYSVTIVAQSRERASDRASADMQLIIRPFTRFSAILDPKRLSRWFLAIYTVTISNLGNHAQGFQLQGRDDEGLLRYRFTPPSPVLRPGESRRVRTRVRLPSSRIIGKPQTYPFDITVTPSDATAAPALLDAELVQQPPLPTWLLWLLAALLLLSLLSCVGLLLYNNRCRVLNCAPTATAVPTPSPSLPTLLPVAPTGVPVPTPDTQATQAAQTTAQAATSVVQNDAFNQTATAISGGNSETQAAFAQSVAQTQTALAINFAQTATAAALSGSQTQTAIAIVNNATATAQANLNATATAGALAAQQTATVQASLNITATANAFAQQQTATANAFAQQQTLTALPGVNAATQTAIAQGFIKTQTAVAFAATQTALAQPTPTPTNTPTPTPEADIIVRFDSFKTRTPIHGDAFVDRGVLICFYHYDRIATVPPEGEPDCNPRGFFVVGGSLDRSDSSLNATTPQSGLYQENPVVYPASQAGNGPSAALTSEYAPCVPSTSYPCTIPPGPVPNSIAVINFPQRSVASVTLNFWLPPDPDNAGIGATYYLEAFDGEGNKIASSNTGALTVPAIYPLTVRSPSSRIQQVQLSIVTERNNIPHFITSITANYSP